MAKKHMKRCSTSLITREIEIRTIMRCHLAPIRTCGTYMQQSIIWPLKNKILPFAAISWMDLEIITLSEVSDKDK